MEARIASIEARIAEREEARAAAAREQEARAAAARVEEPAPEPVVAPPPPERRGDDRPWVAGVGLLAGGGAAVLTGIGFGVAALHQGSVAERECVTVSGSTLCSAAVEEALDRNRVYALVADITIAVGLAAAAAGLYLVLREDDDEGPEVAARARLGGGEVSIAGRF